MAAIVVLPILVVAAIDSGAEIATEETCAGKPEGTECWKPLSDRPDCHVWDDYLVTAQKVTWSGGCVNGRAQGEGTLRWGGGDGDRYTQTGRLQDGKRQGRWDLRESDGSVDEGPYVDGKQHGLRTWRIEATVTGSCARRTGICAKAYVDGKRHGHWVLRDTGGGVAEGPYVDDRQHGHWVVRSTNGIGAEGPFVDGKQHATGS